MSTIVLNVWSDYVCPFCYLEEPVLQEAAREENVLVRWRAFELRPEPVPTLDPKGAYLQQVWKNTVYPLAAERKMTVKLPPVQPRSRRALEAAEFARAKQKFAPMHDELFKAFFEEGRDIADTSVLLQIASSVGLDPFQLLGSLEAREYQPKLISDQRLAQRLGVTSVPVMVFHFMDEPVESGFILTGAQPIGSIRDVLQRLHRAAAEHTR